MKKKTLIRWVLALGLMTVAFVGCKPPTPTNELPSIPSAHSKP